MKSSVRWIVQFVIFLSECACGLDLDLTWCQANCPILQFLYESSCWFPWLEIQCQVDSPILIFFVRMRLRVRFVFNMVLGELSNSATLVWMQLSVCLVQSVVSGKKSNFPTFVRMQMLACLVWNMVQVNSPILTFVFEYRCWLP